MNEKDFTLIVEETKRMVLSAIKKYLYERYYHAIDDVVQEAYLRAYKSLMKNQFQGQSKVSSWLYVIAKNESLRMNKKLLREEKKKEQILLNYNHQKDKEDKDKILDRLTINTIKNKIHLLPIKYNTILSLYIEGYNEGQIAKTLSLPRGTVKSRTHRGKEMLIKLMQGGLNNEQFR